MKKVFLICILLLSLIFTVSCDNTGDPVPINTPTFKPIATLTENPQTPAVTAKTGEKPYILPTTEPGTLKYAGTVDKEKGSNITTATWDDALYSYQGSEDRDYKDITVFPESDDVIAIQFFATVPFNAIRVFSPRWTNQDGEINMKLYRWGGSYEATLEREPIYTVHAAAEENVEWLTLGDFENTLWEDGEYLLAFTDAVSPMPIGFFPNEFSGSARSYINGEVFENNFYAKLYCTMTPEKMVGPLSDPG